MPNKIDLTNKRFERLLVLKEAGRDKQGNVLWHCKCDCGNEVDVCGSHLRNGNTKSCGCYMRDINANRVRSHNLSRTRFYRIWKNIKQRCENIKNPRFYDYGGRGIKCEWSSFIDYMEDMYSSYLDHVEKYGEDNTSIDRINGDGNYSKENCRWATRKEQQNNTKRNHYVVVNGELLTAAQVSEKYGVKYQTTISRLNSGNDIFGRKINN